jgi:hypothetical protein
MIEDGMKESTIVTKIYHQIKRKHFMEVFLFL